MKEFPLDIALRGRYLVFHSPELEKKGITLVFTTRIWLPDGGPTYCNFGFFGKGGAEVHRSELCAALGLNPRKLTSPYQTHSPSVFEVDKQHAGRGGLDPNTRIPQTDGLVTSLEEVPLVALSADCVPVILFDEEKGTVGALHAGWKGILEGMVENVGRILEKKGSRLSAVKVVMGPCIGPECYEVGEELAARLSGDESEAVVHRNQKHFIDLRKWCEVRFLSVGFSKKNIYFANMCVSCNKHLFYSYRADKAQRGSNAAIIALRKAEK
ncbi:MAG: peptidoglycan editing factor PgeF [bacterium]